ncbi:DUF1800 domain-containing protein [Flaviaesturariibacter aridisoli]|uniref:DUF1800 domain-containing protein n=1 Tax=Flaviaesturariibacter aridisoli TaxID=2545761 RepID=A0A4R4E0K2_9BACT|nr:DUF1800 domain-containing protein [Flaviaesturariibacter aridisoli]TCZ70986.1 DUF1800 domain-containing protein [Flaviaesturariibacter aridisoli]
MTHQQKNQHLLWRAGFGPLPADWTALADRKPADWYATLRRDSAAAPRYLNVVDAELMQSYTIPGWSKTVDEATRKRVQLKNNNAIRDINLAWLREMADSKAQLREKIALFWHGHFCTLTLNIHYAQQLLQVLRTHGLGNFRTLLGEVARSAAMMLYLNAQSNRKGHPNENFAREVMELFTLGRGHYTENDIKEAARAFTGWWVETDGTFKVKPAEHDEGSKTVLGHTGNWNGEQVLDFLLQQKDTAVHITRKLYRFLVSDTPDERRVAALADRFYKSNYEIGTLLDDIFTSTWFYEPALYGARIKSPVELLTGIRRTLALSLDNEEQYLMLQRVLGQILFFPPNVAGWPGGRSWIDSTTLMLRMRLPQMFNEKDALNVQVKPNNDLQPQSNVVNAVYSNAKVRTLEKNTRFDVRMDWKAQVARFASVKREELVPAIAGALLPSGLQVPPSLITSYANSDSRESFIKTATLQVMSLPEYQLC